MASILIVDDSPDSREALAALLKTSGHEVICVPNGREALVQVLNHAPDVVLLDLLMPEMDGPSFLKVVRSYLRLKSLPVVVYTGISDNRMIDRAKALTVNTILVKGTVSPLEILQAVDEAILTPQ